jgi:hypothetical protein
MCYPIKMGGYKERKLFFPITVCVWGDPKESQNKSTHEMKDKVYMNTFQ